MSSGDPENNIYYSPIDVLKNPSKYENEMKRINAANLDYPIIIYNNNIVDGVHRVTKAKLLGVTVLKAYIFDDDLIKKFLLNNEKDWSQVSKLNIHDYIELFYDRFINKKN